MESDISSPKAYPMIDAEHATPCTSPSTNMANDVWSRTLARSGGHSMQALLTESTALASSFPPGPSLRNTAACR